MSDPERPPGPPALRRAGDADVTEITRIINAAYLVERSFIDGERIDAAEVRGHLRDDVILVLEEGGRMTGCVLVKVHGERGYLGLLSVDPGLQGGGRGRHLVAAAEAWCKDEGCTVIDLWVVSLREELPPFYRRLGYVEGHTRPWPPDSASRLKRPAHFIIYSKPL